MNVEAAIADLKTQFERAVPRSTREPSGESVSVEQPTEGSWLFSLHAKHLASCKLAPSGLLWLDNKRISTKLRDLAFVAARFEGEHTLIVEVKDVRIRRRRPKQRLRLPSWGLEPEDLLGSPVRKIAVTRSVRALLRVLRDADLRAVENAASQSTDLGVVARALEQPEAIELLKRDDPFAVARLRGVQERERLLSEEGGTWAVEEVAKHLQLTRQAVNRRRKLGMLLALDAGRHGFRYPAWQFARKGTIDGLEQVLNALGHLDPWMRQAFMLGTNARLQDRRAVDVLRAGGLAAVVRAGSAFGEHGAA